MTKAGNPKFLTKWATKMRKANFHERGELITYLTELVRTSQELKRELHHRRMVTRTLATCAMAKMAMLRIKVGLLKMRRAPRGRGGTLTTP